MTIIIRDTMTAADGTRLSARPADTGQTWIEQAGTWTIDGNKVHIGPMENHTFAITDVGVINFKATVECDLTSIAWDGGIGVRFGAGGADLASGHFFLLIFEGFMPSPYFIDHVILYECNGGTFTARGDSGPTSYGGGMHKIGIELDGDNIICSVDDVNLFSYNSSVNNTNTKVALNSYRDADFELVTLDNFEVDDGNVSGSLTKTLGPVTSSSTTTVNVSASLSKALGALAVSASGAVGVDASLVKTLGSLTVASAATGSVAVDLNVTLGALTITAAGVLAIQAQLNAGLSPVVLSAAVDVTEEGTVARLDATLGLLTLQSRVSAVSRAGISAHRCPTVSRERVNIQLAVRSNLYTSPTRINVQTAVRSNVYVSNARVNVQSPYFCTN